MNFMNVNSQQTTTEETDPLIDEVRTIRRSICDEFGNDLEKLVAHLSKVEDEYRTRTGCFTAVPRQIEGELFPDVARDEAEPFVSDICEVRKT